MTRHPQNRQPHDPDRILDALRAIGEHDPLVTVREFCRTVGVSVTSIYDHFGSWSDLRERAGLSRVGKRGLPRGTTDETIRADLQRLLADRAAESRPDGQPGRPPTMAEFTRHSGHTRSIVNVHFGSWTALLALEGLTPPRGGPTKITDAEIRTWIENVRLFLDREPTIEELGLVSPYAAATFHRRLKLFGYRERLQREWRRRLLQRQAERTAREGLGPVGPAGGANDGERRPNHDGRQETTGE